MAAPLADLSRRDRAILADLDQVRLLTGSQLERLHFAGLATANTRGSARRRSLARLAALKLVTTLPRRVGGIRAGSTGLVYTLDSRAQRQRWLWEDRPLDGRIRRPWAIGWSFVCHGLDVSELYVRFRERERASDFALIEYAAEPASWFDTAAGVLKPDAFAVYESRGWEQHRWIEVDRATESMPTLGRKLRRYLDLAIVGSSGPRGVLPQVVVTVPHQRRLDAVSELLASFGSDNTGVITVALFADVLQPGRPPP